MIRTFTKLFVIALLATVLTASAFAQDEAATVTVTGTLTAHQAEEGTAYVLTVNADDANLAGKALNLTGDTASAEGLADQTVTATGVVSEDGSSLEVASIEAAATEEAPAAE